LQPRKELQREERAKGGRRITAVEQQSVKFGKGVRQNSAVQVNLPQNGQKGPHVPVFNNYRPGERDSIQKEERG